MGFPLKSTKGDWKWCRRACSTLRLRVCVFGYCQVLGLWKPYRVRGSVSVSSADFVHRRHRVRHHVLSKTSDASDWLAPHFQSATGFRLRQVRWSNFQRRVCVVCRRGRHHTLFEAAWVYCFVSVVCRKSKGQVVDGKSRVPTLNRVCVGYINQ